MKKLIKSFFLVCVLTLMSTSLYSNPIVVAEGTISEIYLNEDGSWFVEVYITGSGCGLYINIESSSGYSTYSTFYEEMSEGFYVFTNEDFEDFEFDPNGDYLLFGGGDGIVTETVFFGDYPGSLTPPLASGCGLVNKEYNVYGGSDWTFDGKPTPYYYSDDFMPGSIMLTVLDFNQEPIGNMAINSPTIDPEYFVFGDEDGVYYPLIRCDLEPVSFFVSDLNNTYFDDELFVYPGDTVEHTITLDINNFSSLQGNVTMEDGSSPIGAKVLFTPINPDNESFTGVVEREDGFYNVSVKTGIYQVCAFKEGFEPRLLLDGVSVVGSVTQNFELSPCSECIFHETENEILSGSLDEGIHYFLNDVVIPENETLALYENTEIHTVFGNQIIVEGQISAHGFSNNEILFATHRSHYIKDYYFLFGEDYNLSEFSYCTFEHIPQIFALNADSVFVENCYFLENKSIGDIAAGSYLNIQHSFIQSYGASQPVITLFDNGSLNISETTFDQTGGLLISDSAKAVIDHSIFTNMDNSFSVKDNCDVILRNNLFYENENALILLSKYYDNGIGSVLNFNITLQNSIFANNNKAVSSDRDMTMFYLGSSNISHNDFRNNTYDKYNLWINEIGPVEIVNINGDSCDNYFNIFLDPQLDEEFHLTWDSPCINAGSPDSPLDPDGTIADIGPFFYDLSTQIEELSKDIIHVNSYPNPASDIIHFDISANEDISGTAVLTIYNMNGVPVTELYEPIAATNTASISLSFSLKNRGINAGLYVYTLVIPGRDATSGKITVVN
ncbi:MAG: hypothetical protein C0593_02015 [Marinilabiliales bacterium]|nr:MAG: hypothetical protein C0593_02015 [Marinilabiliales bacterium]